MLGKGLESLIPKKNENQESRIMNNESTAQTSGDNFSSPKPPQTNDGDSSPLEQKHSDSKRKALGTDAIFLIEVDIISPNPHQPRKNFNEESLRELSASIREFGILQPIIVSKIEKETETGTSVGYQLIAGERRLLAAKMSGLERIPAIIKNISNKSEHLEIAIIENLQRTDLNSIETARAYAKLQDEFGLTQREIAVRLSKSRETIANALRLLNLPTEIQDALIQNKINESQARLLLSVSNLMEQKNLFNGILNNSISVRELRNRIRKPQSINQPTNQSTNIVDPETNYLQEQLTELLSAQVKIYPPRLDGPLRSRDSEASESSPGKSVQGGKIVITFYSPEEIRGIIDKLTS